MIGVAAIIAATVTAIGTIITAVATTTDMVRASNCTSAGTVTVTIGGIIITDLATMRE